MLHASWLVPAVAAAALALTAAPAGAASLYDGPGPRPGPDILYADPPRAPQLENTGDWRAAPILVSGAMSYRGGEFVYQDFLYDDHGARGARRDQNDPRSGDDSFSGPNGTYTYPRNEAYAQNAADLVELRVKPVGGATLFRLTLNTMIDPELAAATIAIGDSPVALPMPHGANVRAPAQFFLTWHGGTAELVNAATGTPVGPAPGVAVDRERRQVELRVPHAAWNPGTGTVKLAAGVGLWDRGAGQYLVPASDSSESRPGGAAGLAAPPAFFNVAFRRHDQEPLPAHGSPELVTDPAWWRDRAQAEALEAGDISAFRAEVDFGRLAAGTNDDGAVPAAGPINRIYASRFETRQGVDFNEECGQPADCKGELRGRLQPYALYVPSKRGQNGYGMTLLLHSLGAGFNQFTGSRNQSQFGERGSGSLVATPSGRGPDAWYYGEAGADTFEVWADVARRYPLDPAYTAISGYSMGGYGTYKFATQYPDLFARAQPTVGPPGIGIATTPDNPSGGRKSSTFPMLGSLRHVPTQMWVGTTDELVPFPGTQLHARRFDDLDYRYEFWAFAPADHFALAIFDQYQPAADFLGAHRVDRDPARVTYVRNPTMDFPDSGQVANHAYWLSGVEVANPTEEDPFGTIDVRSEGFGTGDPEATGTLNDAGTLTGGNPPLPGIGYQRQRKEWASTPSTPRRNRLVVEASNIRTVTIDAQRARVDCNAQLAVASDSPITVRVSGCPARRFASSAACGSRGRPRASISRRGLTARRTRLAAGGRAIAFRCIRNRARRGGTVARVELSAARKSGRRCRFVTSRGRLGKPRSCSRIAWVRARMGRQRGGKVPWTFRSSKARLPRGIYTLRVRAVDRTGTVGKTTRRHGRKSIRVR